MKEKLKLLLELMISFFKIGIMTFGGGLAMLPMMQRELIQKRKWITDDELIDYYAIGQSTPGIIAVNVATFVGYKKLGVFGGIFATFGIVFPSILIICILAVLINSISDFPLVQKALQGINVAVAALLVKVAAEFSKKTIKGLLSTIIFCCTFVLVYFFKIPSFYVIIAAMFVGIILYFVNLKKLKKTKGDDNE